MSLVPLGYGFGQEAADPLEVLSGLGWGDSLDHCGNFARGANAAVAAGQLGQSILPKLESLIQQVESGVGNINPASHWLLLVYAKVEGAKALPVLLRLSQRNDANAWPSLHWIDLAIAIAKGVTAHVDAREEWTERASPCRSPLPTHSMTRLILAWLKGDDASHVATQLTPEAQRAWLALTRSGGWNRLQSSLRGGQSSKTKVVEYTFKTEGIGAHPEEPLDDSSVLDQSELTLETTFFDQAGTSCGERGIHFRLLASGSSFPRYLIDERDLVGLFRIVSLCASR